MRKHMFLLAVGLLSIAVVTTVPLVGKAGPPGEVAIEKAITNDFSLETVNYEFIGSTVLLSIDKLEAAPAKSIEVLKSPKPTKAVHRDVKRQDKVPRLSNQVRLIQKIPPLMA